MLIRIGLTCEAQLGHRTSNTGESESDPSGHRVNHHEISCLEGVDPIYKQSTGSDSDGSQEVFMVGQGERPTNQIEEEIDRAAEAEVT
jgi:hypothetical protein